MFRGTIETGSRGKGNSAFGTITINADNRKNIGGSGSQASSYP